MFFFLGSADGELEAFNVRVLYDKLEDQNLHLASQLARQQEDLQGFYNRICSQNDELKKLLGDLDPAKLEQLDRARRQAGGAMREGLLGAAMGGATVVNTNISYAGAAGQFGAGGRCYWFL